MQPFWYSDRRISWPIVVLGTIVLVVLGIFIAIKPQSFFLFFAAELVVAFVLIGFYELRVVADETTVYLEYGVGLFRREIPIFRMVELSPVENENIFCLLYPPFDSLALKIKMREGRTVMIPTSDPKEFARALILRGAAR